MKLSDVIGGLDAGAADRFAQWCKGEIVARSDGSEFAAYAGRFDARYVHGDRHELFVEFDDEELTGGEALSAVKVLIAAVWEHRFDEWAEANPDGPAHAARTDATRAQRAIITAVWVQLAVVSGATPAAAAVAADLGPDWVDDGSGSAAASWADLLAAAEALSR